MQEEVTNKVISLNMRAAKMTADLLRAAMRKYLAEQEKHGQRARETARQEKRAVQPQGKQSLKKMMEQGSELKNIEITDNNIKSFGRVARKYGIAYSLKKDVSVKPPKYMVFFKAKDVDVMTAAFKEYAGISLKKSKRVSVRRKLMLAKERVAKQRERQKDKKKDRGQSL